MARHARAGDEVSVLFMTNGVGARGVSNEAEQSRSKAMENAARILGVKQLQRLDFPDNAMDSIPLLDVARAIEAAVSAWGQPDVVYTHHPGDLNVDHQRTYQATLTCFRPQPGAQKVPFQLLSFEVLSATGWRGSDPAAAFLPNVYRDITETLEAKLEALRAYELEMRPWPHARSLETVTHLARYRGAMVGLPAAEAFVLERLVQ